MIKLTDIYAIEPDYQESWALWKYYEGGEEIKHGKYKGQLTKSGWKSESKYFPKIDQAVKYVANISSKDSESLQEFLDKYESITKEVVDNINKYDSTNLQQA